MGVRSTQCVESINALVKQHVNHRSDVLQVALAVHNLTASRQNRLNALEHGKAVDLSNIHDPGMKSFLTMMSRNVVKEIRDQFSKSLQELRTIPFLMFQKFPIILRKIML